MEENVSKSLIINRIEANKKLFHENELTIISDNFNIIQKVYLIAILDKIL